MFYIFILIIISLLIGGTFLIGSWEVTLGVFLIVIAVHLAKMKNLTRK